MANQLTYHFKWTQHIFFYLLLFLLFFSLFSSNRMSSNSMLHMTTLLGMFSCLADLLPIQAHSSWTTDRWVGLFGWLVGWLGMLGFFCLADYLLLLLHPSWTATGVLNDWLVCQHIGWSVLRSFGLMWLLLIF